MSTERRLPAGRNLIIRAVRRLLVQRQWADRLSRWLFDTHKTLPGALARPTAQAVMRLYYLRDTVDFDWYRETYSDIGECAAHPGLHYIAFGWREGRPPSGRFSPPIRSAPGWARVNPVSHVAFFPEPEVALQAPPDTKEVRPPDTEEVQSPAGQWFGFPAASQNRPVSIVPQRGLWDLLDAEHGSAEPHPPTRLLLIDRPTPHSLECARRAADASGSSTIFAHLNPRGDRLLIRRSLDQSPQAFVVWPRDQLPAMAFIQAHRPETITVVHAARGTMDLELLLDCLALPLSVLATDYGLLRSDDGLEELPGAPLRFAARAEAIACSSALMAERLRQATPGLPIEFLPLADPLPRPVRKTPTIGPDLRVLIIGDLTESGGRTTVIEAARIVASGGLPIALTVLGQIRPSLSVEEQRGAALVMTGAFDPADGAALIAAIDPHLLWSPAGLSAPANLALRAAALGGLPVLAGDTPVMAELLHGLPHVLFEASALTAQAWIERMSALHLNGIGS